MAILPRDLQVHAERYIATTAHTVDSLFFMLDNIGLHKAVTLDLSLDSIDTLEQIAVDIHKGVIPADAFPELLSGYAFLFAQYCALAILKGAPAAWSIDASRSSYHFGEPYVDADPCEGWQRYYPLDAQRGLNGKVFLSKRQLFSFRERAAGLIEARLSFEKLRVEIETCIEEAPGAALGESDLLKLLEQRGHAPDPGAFRVAYRGFPKRVSRLLRGSGDFRKNRSTGLWQKRA